MAICIASTAAALSLAGSAFTLSWIHSVERTEWQEHWQIGADGSLLIDWARVQGSGAGMEPPADAVLREGWWWYRPRLPAQSSLRLAVSGATVSGWQLCVDGGDCHDIETRVGGGMTIDSLRISADDHCAVDAYMPTPGR